MKKIVLTLLVLSSFLIVKNGYCRIIDGGFSASDVDESNTVTKYYGSTAPNETDWVIMRSSEVSNITQYRYTTGNENYEAWWSSRTLLNYYNRRDMYKYLPSEAP